MGDQDFERLFQEQFSDFEADPLADSWEHIQAELQKPLLHTYPWLRITAAVLLCFMFMPLGRQNPLRTGYNIEEDMPSLSEAMVPPIAKDSSYTPLDELSYVQPTSQVILKSAKVVEQKASSYLSPLRPINSLSSRGLTVSKINMMLPGTILPPTSDLVPVIKKPSYRAFRKVRLYVEGTPFLTYHHFSPSTRDVILVDSYTAASSFNKNRLGYQLSLGLDLNIAPRVQLTTGLFYRVQRQAVTFQTSDLEENQFERTENGYNITPTFITTFHQYQVSYQSLGGHVMGLYQLWPSHKGKTQHVGVGFQGGHLMNYREIVDDTDSFLSASQQIYSVNLAYRITYQISPQLSLSLQPTLNYFLINKKQTAPVSARPYTFGMGIGVRYSNRDK